MDHSPECSEACAGWRDLARFQTEYRRHMDGTGQPDRWLFRSPLELLVSWFRVQIQRYRDTLRCRHGRSGIHAKEA